MPSTELLLALRRALVAEQETRWRQKGYNPSISARVQLYERLDRMAANRRRLAGELPPLTPKDHAELEAFLTMVACEQATAKG
jgi:hypothetical protein